MNALSEFFGVYAFDAIWLTLKLALITSGLLLLVTLPLAWFLANWHSKAKPFVMSVLALPLVLPPTVLGFYLLIAFSPQSALGQGWHTLTGSNLAFSFEGLVLGSVLYSLPFALQPLYGGFSQLDMDVTSINPELLDMWTNAKGEPMTAIAIIGCLSRLT